MTTKEIEFQTLLNDVKNSQEKPPVVLTRKQPLNKINISPDLIKQIQRERMHMIGECYVL
tara:strand:- start:1176 stop:1355 length:180 start_codon:yes stop_codon:yes gene_type:complete